MTSTYQKRQMIIHTNINIFINSFILSVASSLFFVLSFAHIMNVLIANKWLNTIIGFLIGFMFWSAYILWSGL